MKETAAAPKLPPSPSSPTKHDKKEAMSTSDRILKTEKELLLGKERTIQLHNQWHGYLKRISIFVIGLAIHQMWKIALIVLSHEKDTTNNDNNNTPILMHSINSILSLINNASCEVVGLVLCITSSLFLFSLAEISSIDKATSNKNTLYEFWHSKIYALCSILVLVQLSLYGLHRHNHHKPEFHISVVFYVIITAALYFMKYGMKEMNKHLDLINLMKVQSRHIQKITSTNARVRRQKKSKKIE